MRNHYVLWRRNRRGVILRVEHFRTIADALRGSGLRSSNRKDLRRARVVRVRGVVFELLICVCHVFTDMGEES